MFFTTKLTFSKELANLYVGLEDGSFCDYTTLAGQPFGIAYGENSYTGPDATPYKSFYSVGRNGLPVSYIKNNSFDFKERQWYKNASSTRINFWTAPYIDAHSGNPVLSLVYPILNYTLKGQYMEYAGTLAADVYLSQISDYLEKAYYKTDMNVYIVDQSTLSLLGNSWGSMTHVLDPSGRKVSRTYKDENRYVNSF